MLKNDIATMYAGYIAKQEDAMPGKLATNWKVIVLHHSQTHNWRWKATRSPGVDYIKVNFHIDNFTIVDKLVDVSWKKPELEAYLSHYNIKKSGNKSELIKRVEEHMLLSSTCSQLIVCHFYYRACTNQLLQSRAYWSFLKCSLRAL